MNYTRNEYELSNFPGKLYNYKFKQKAIKFYEGADVAMLVGYAQWEERCKRLLETFYSRDGKNSGIILFPDVEIALRSEICQVQTWPRVLRTLSEWCKSSGLRDTAGLIIRNYDLNNHFYFRGITNDEIKDTLNVSNSKNIFSFQENDKRFLAFNPSLRIILIIRLIELEKGELQLVKKEVDYCIDEVNLLCFLLKDELAHTGVTVTGLIAYSGENAHSQSRCEDCDNIIFPFEIFNSGKTFKKFFKSFFSEKRIEAMRMRYVTKCKANVFQAVASKILGYLSHYQFAMLQEPVLPVLQQDATDNIKQAELLLDCYQMEIAYSDDKRIWLEGNYGTGKTVVALKKLELLLKALKDKEVIYYINFARKSSLHLLIKQRFKIIKNVKAIRSEYSLSNTIKHQILPKERELGTKNIHLVVDEYSSQDLSTKEVKSLIPILNEEKEFVNSTVLIAVQPIEINRIDNFYENGLKMQFSETKHELSKLITATGIKVRILKNVMRTTVQINDFAEFTREYLDNQSNRCVRQEQYYDNRSSIKEVADLDLGQRKLKETSCNSSLQSISLESNLSLIETSDDSFNCATGTRAFQTEKLIDYDELYKLAHTKSIEAGKNYQETLTSYHYTCHSKIGHGINGPLPRVITLAESTDLIEQTALIAAVFHKVIAETKPISIVVIHFESKDPPLWLKSLFELKSISQILKMTINLEKYMKHKSENLVLVKQLNFLRGLEFSKVLLILDSNEHHLRHFIPDAIARCMENLTILIRPPVHGNYSTDTVADLANKWEKHRDSDILRLVKIGFCLKRSCNSKNVQPEAYCKDETSYGTYYKFHQNSKLYKDFLKEIKLKKVGNVEPEYKEKQKEAKAV